MRNKLTQHRKILDFCSDGKFHCQNEFRANFIFSPHKRREEIEKGLPRQGIQANRYRFEKRKCEHGIKNQYDYKLVENPPTEVKTYKVEGRIVAQERLW